MRKRVARYGRIAPVALTIGCVASGIVAGCSSGQPAPTSSAFAGAARPAGSWADPNGDLTNTRDAVASRISSANVASLKEAWTFKLSGTAATGVSDTGSLAAAPVVVDGTVYLQDLYANVYAISLPTGALKWEYQANLAEKSGPGPDGVAVANGVVYGDTSTAVFALNAATGKVIWNDGSLLSSGQGSFEIQPAVAGGRVYLASAYGSGPGGGVILALDAATGKELWTFNTVAGSAAPGVQALGLGSGGAWETPLVGTDGSVTFGTGNPYQSIGEAVSHPARQLYTDSEVNVSAATGKLNWYYQAVPNDFNDHDLQTSPIAATVGGVPAIIASGKVGIVYAMNAVTGALLWETLVGVHNGHDNDSALLLAHQLTIKLPYTVEPGPLGGVLTNMAMADGSVYLATIDLPVTYAKLTAVNGDQATGVAPTGEIEALNVNTGKVEWDTKVPTLPLGAATVSNDLVFTTLYNGELLALNRSTGVVVYQHKLPTSTNSPIAVTSNAILVPAGGAVTSAKGGGGSPQLVAYTIR
ncbi:MAG: PQQ-binding-like beta-propeller repeat protein [Trebonia sp.]